MTDMIEIAETIGTEFVRTVAAAAKAQEAAVDDLRRQISEANADRVEGLVKVRKMREDAARTLAESIKLEEATESAFSSRMREIDTVMDGLRMMRAKRPAIGVAA